MRQNTHCQKVTVLPWNLSFRLSTSHTHLNQSELECITSVERGRSKPACFESPRFLGAGSCCIVIHTEKCWQLFLSGRQGSRTAAIPKPYARDHSSTPLSLRPSEKGRGEKRSSCQSSGGLGPLARKKAIMSAQGMPCCDKGLSAKEMRGVDPAALDLSCLLRSPPVAVERFGAKAKMSLAAACTGEQQGSDRGTAVVEIC